MAPAVDTSRVQALARDEEQVGFWLRHTRLGVALCVVLPSVAALRTLLATDPSHPHQVLALAAVVVLSSPLLLLVPVPRLVRHPRGRWFFDAWEATGVALVVVFALLDGGAESPYLLFLYVLLAHAALAYPPAGMLLAGAGNLFGYLTVALVGGDVAAAELLTGSLTLVVATATCAAASSNHLRAYRRVVALADQVAVLAARDGLTGCLNHRTFHERLQAEAVAADGAHPLALLLLDVDDFKAVNDTYGHPAGDAVLRDVGSALLEVARERDTPGRLGGDEFGLLLPGTSLAGATALAERVRELVAAGEGPGRVTISVGVAVMTARGEYAGLLASADRAVYVAKRSGRDRVAGGSTPPVPEPRRSTVPTSRA